MADVDLIPADYSRSRLVQRRVTQLLIACVSLAVVVGVARLTLQRLISIEKADIARLENKGQLSTRSKAEADHYRQQTVLAQKQLAELDELRGGDRLRLLLQAIDAAYSESIWLDELRLLRRDRPGGKTGTLPAGGASGIIVVPRPEPNPTLPALTAIEQRVELSGHAANHTRLAEFMRRLAGQPGIADVRLTDTALGSYLNSPVIDLTLTLLVDDKVRKRL